MKLNAVASAFKKNKILYILDDSHGNQWLSNKAAYATERFDKEGTNDGRK